MTVKEIANLCAWCYKSGYDSAVDVLKGTQHINDEEKLTERFVNIVQQRLYDANAQPTKEDCA